MEPRRVHIRTFGCQMNVYDSGKMRALLAADGFVPTDSVDDADLVIANTCSVREKPEQKLHSFLGEVRPQKKHRKVLVAVAGCVAQQEGRTLLRRYPDVDLVFGPDAVPRIRDLVAEASRRRVLDVDFLTDDAYVFASELDPAAASQTSAFVTIQKGCDNKCTFCIVPATRGAELTRPSAEVLAEVRALADAGVREVTLLGQNVNSYGLKVPGEKTFAQLLYAVAAVPGIERIRFTTSHPRDMGPDVVQAYRDLPTLQSHLHLPVQSGSDAVLRRMKRFYTRDDYARLVHGLRTARPDLALTTDFIVGFPGETDQDFVATMDLLETVRFHQSFSFKFSPRPGTPALKLMERGQEVPGPVAQRRLEVLQARQKEIGWEENRRVEGEVVDVLVEGQSRDDADVLTGRTGTFKTVNFPGSADLVGRIVPVRIVRGFAYTLRGETVAETVGASAWSAVSRVGTPPTS